MTQKALGNVMMVVHQASGKHVSLANAGGVVFVVYEDGGATAVTLKESIAGQSEQALGAINEIFASNGVGGVSTRETTDANGALSGSSSFVKKDTTAFDQAAFEVLAEDLSEGFDSVECTVDGGQCTAIVYSLATKRAPANQPVLAV